MRSSLSREWFEQYRHNWAQEKGASWAVTRGDGEVLGRIALGSLNLDDGVAGCAYSDAVHADGRHDMHLHARIRGDGPVDGGI